MAENSTILPADIAATRDIVAKREEEAHQYPVMIGQHPSKWEFLREMQM